ncbi:SMP-30/gluconolactonase/LRE family protein [Edaphobacter sp. 4G125]|nr:SMP-30/gluconolactonase/LRE family protein [Edaphobacter sp. 4G125]
MKGSNNPSMEIPVQIERLDPAADALLPQHPVWHRVATGFTWVEGPIWIHSGYLMFADIPSNSIRKVDSHGDSIWLQPSGYRGQEPYGGKESGSNGMTLDPAGRLTVAGHAARNVMRFESMDPHGTVTILADSYQGKKLNSPNDLVYGPDGSLYFTDPPYGLRTQNDSDPHKELKINGVYRIPNATKQKPGSQPDRNALQLLVSDLPRPNGIAFSPDGKWLYVSNSEPKFWMRYSVKEDGTLGAGSIFLDASNDKRNGAPDGIKVDAKGNLFAAGPGGVWIISPTGKHLATLLTEKSTANMAWGGADGRTLYTTTTDSVFSIRLNTTGLRP